MTTKLRKYFFHRDFSASPLQSIIVNAARSLNLGTLCWSSRSCPGSGRCLSSKFRACSSVAHTRCLICICKKTRYWLRVVIICLINVFLFLKCHGEGFTTTFARSFLTICTKTFMSPLKIPGKGSTLHEDCDFDNNRNVIKRLFEHPEKRWKIQKKHKPLITHRESFVAFESLSTFCYSIIASTSTSTVFYFGLEMRWAFAGWRFRCRRNRRPRVRNSRAGSCRAILVDTLALRVICHSQAFDTGWVSLKLKENYVKTFHRHTDRINHSHSVYCHSQFLASVLCKFRGLWNHISSSTLK